MPATGKSEIQDSVYDSVSYNDAITSSSDEDISYNNNFLPKVSVKSNYFSTVLATVETTPTVKDHEELIRNCVELLLKHAVFEGTNRKNKVLEFRTPDQLKKVFDFKVGSSPSTHDELLQLLQNTIRYSVKTGHPYFANQLFSSLDPYGLIGQWLTDALNPSVYTFEVSPVFTLMEEEVLKEMRKIVGYKDGKGDGIFCPGGSMANGYAINCARFKYMPDIKVSLFLLYHMTKNLLSFNMKKAVTVE